MPTLYTALRATHNPIRRVAAAKRLALPSIAKRRDELVSTRIPEPPQKPREGLEVIIVGAGFAGLSAAYELHHAGYGVTVLEAQHRLGGRVKSLDDFVPGKNVEA